MNSQECLFGPGSEFLSQYSHLLRYSTVQYSTVQYSTVQYSTVQYSTLLLRFRRRTIYLTTSCAATILIGSIGVLVMARDAGG